MTCDHRVLKIEFFDDFAAYCSCLHCGQRVEVDTGVLEGRYMGFESTDPPTWDQPARAALLVKRTAL